MNEYQYILQYILPELNANNVQMTLDFENDVVVDPGDGVRCSGYFDDKRKILVCAVGNKNFKDWFTTLIHEYCHVKQWADNCPAWQEGNSFPLEEFFIEHLAGVDVPDIANKVKKLANLELDCEKRATHVLTEEFSDRVDINEYIRKSNAYVAFYAQVLVRKKWYIGEKAPYLNEAVYSKMPKEFQEIDWYFNNNWNGVNWDSCFEEEK